jgi:hypothetical protein
MPLYVYAVIESDGSDGEIFEVLQDLNEPPLTVHPETGQSVHRVLSAPNVKRSASALGKPDLSPKNLERLGLTQYRRSSSGRYEKTAGGGPDLIQK